MPNKFFPVSIDLNNKNILVIGAGKIALRKVKTLLDYNCNITVITKEISEENIHSEILKLPKEMLENVTLTADEHLEYGYIVEVMSKLRNENVKNVSLNIQKNNK